MALLHRPALPFPRSFGRRVSGKLLAALAAAFVIGVAVLQVNQFSRATSTSYEIEALNRERAAKQARNYELEAEVAQLSSLGRVEWDARTRLHLVPAERRLYIDVNQPVPDRQTLPTRFLPSGTDAEPADGAGASARGPWWERILATLLP